MIKLGTDANSLLGHRVRARRLELGMSQEQVGDLAGIHCTNWGKIERGRANPSLLASSQATPVPGAQPC